MHLSKLNRNISKLQLWTRRYSHAALPDENEYTETPVYPPILDMSLQGRKLRERQSVHEKIKNLNTVEEKQIALNMPRYYGWKCVMLNENRVPYNALPLVQCYTRTHFKPVNSLPDVYSETNPLAEQVVKETKSIIEDIIAVESESVKYIHNNSQEKSEEQLKEENITKNIVRQINRVICNKLADKLPHIFSAQIDYEPRHEAFWFVGGVDVPQSVIQWRKRFNWMHDRLDENIDRPVQYIGTPHLAVRSQLPLKPILPYEEATNPDFKVPKFTYVPESIGYSIEHRHGTNIPGYWPGDYDEFGLLSYHGRDHILSRKETYGHEDNINALHSQALKASFGWLLAQANYQGFTTYNDITYPLVTQTVITNAKLWSFYVYQMNTISMHNEQMDENPKHNICFGTTPLQLYDTIENGQVKGMNEDVLKMLVQFYLNTPEEREHDMKPYLGKDEQLIADIEDDNKRCWLESTYKHIVSNRPRHKLMPEIYLWERIYKIEHNTRFFEAKRRFFERDINPYKRRLNEHLPPYIPKALREYPRSKKKFERTYYPDV
ncbi:PREDICTED: 28S ribosomal protein S30, mitochondrial [Papilio polytes]|uniref:28S ribosomal protein S30, mitochondrial n=1 Tax=Papilio polytes TaxID=76194 RepID=UPI000675FF51|nr:PREDICTED: 28S ribosomal protein S30, mitochondrial [Papilio polytes]